MIYTDLDSWELKTSYLSDSDGNLLIKIVLLSWTIQHLGTFSEKSLNIDSMKKDLQKDQRSKDQKDLLRNWVFATNSDFLDTIFLEPNVADLRYFKLWILLA